MADTTDRIEQVHAVAGRVAAAFAADQKLAERLNDAHQHLLAANDRLWSGLDPKGLDALYSELPQWAVQLETAVQSSSEVLESNDPLGELQRAHWEIHRAHSEYQSAAEERRNLAADIGELFHELIDGLVSLGWSEDRARDVDVAKLARGEIELQ